MQHYSDWLHRLQRDFVVTTADKLSSNYVVVCKKHYIKRLLADLMSGQFYEPVDVATNQPDAVHTAASALLHTLLQPGCHVRNMYHTVTSSEELLQQLMILPFEAAVVKLHKQPVALRFLACSGSNGLKPPAMWLTTLFKCLHPDLMQKWSAVLLTANLEWLDPPWYATRSAQVVDAVRRLNCMHLSLEEFVHGGGWHGYDVVRLYTNNDLHDLVARLSCVIGWAWEFHTTQQGDQVVQVFEDSFHGCRWWQGIASLYDPVHGYGAPGAYNATVRKGMYNACCGRDPVKGKFYVFTKNHVVEVLTWRVQDSYVHFGDNLSL